MRQRAWRYALAAGALLTAAYYLVPGTAAQDAVYALLGLFPVVGIVVGVCWHRPAQGAHAWLALAAANFFFFAGDQVYDYYDLVLHRDVPFPSIADALYLAGYPFLVVAVLGLTRRSDKSRQREDRADAAIVALGALALVWHFLMQSYASDASLSTFGKAVELAYPIMDLGVLFTLVMALVAGRARRPADQLVTAGLVAMMIADVGYDLLILHGSYNTPSPIDVFFLASYVLLAAAGLHPSMAAAGADLAPIRSEARRRLPVVALAGFIAPTVFIVSGVTHTPVDLPFLGATSIVLFALVVARVSWLLRGMHDQTLVLREQSRTLHEALNIQRELEDDLRHQAFHDSLTGLPNRALLHDRVEHALAAALRSSATVAVLFCDLDGFKSVNDSFGHHVGDDLLVSVAKRLGTVVRASDTVARLGGDEFAVLMDDIVDPAMALTIAERIVSVVRQPVAHAQTRIKVSVSVGVAFGSGDKTAEVLLSEADAAMYAAKTAGKDRVEKFREQMRTSVMRRMELRSAFEQGLQREHFRLQYQPHFRLSDGALEGFEALLRWYHPTHGNIGPAEFVPLAEESGFIVPLGRWVLDTACAAAAAWSDESGRGATIAVNVSARQIEHRDFVSDVRAALAYSGLPAHRLVLEVTESMLMTDTANAREVLCGLKELGVRIALDDFGTGYSSLSQLRRFPIDILKIDKSFIDPLANPSSEADAFVSTILRLARELRLATVAEGVEDVVQKHALIELGCDSAQGYLFSRPLALADAQALIATARVADTAGTAGIAPVADDHRESVDQP